MAVRLVIDVADASFEPADVIAQIAGNAAGGRRLLEPAAFHADHLDAVADVAYQRGLRLRRGVRQRPGRRLHARP